MWKSSCQRFCNSYSSVLRRRIHCRLAHTFVPRLPGRYYFTAEGGVSRLSSISFRAMRNSGVLMSPFLQLLQFRSEEEKPLPFGTKLCIYAAWEVLFYCGRRRFRLSSISFRDMRNCGSLHVNFFFNSYSSVLRSRNHCRLAQSFLPRLPGRY